MIEWFASQHHLALNRSHRLFSFGSTLIELHSVNVAIPRTYMNESGMAVTALRDYCHFTPDQLVVIHDDLDLPVGQLRFKKGGRDGGHKGVRSVIGAMETDRFWRLKLGIGHATSPADDVSYVLEKVPAAEWRRLTEMVELAAQSMVCFAVQGSETAMNRYNQRPAE